MNYTRDIIMTHPQKIKEPKLDALVNAIHACFNTGQTCVTCADACADEQSAVELRDVIRLNNDCSDICILKNSVEG